MTTRGAQNDRGGREFRMTFLVTIDGAVGGVKDLEYQILRFAQNDRQPPVIQLLSCAQRRQSGNVSAHWLHTIPAFPSIVFPAKLCLSLISHTGLCR